MIYDLYRWYRIYIEEDFLVVEEENILVVEEEDLLLGQEDILLVHDEDILLVQYMKHQDKKSVLYNIYIWKTKMKKMDWWN